MLQVAGLSSPLNNKYSESTFNIYDVTLVSSGILLSSLYGNFASINRYQSVSEFVQKSGTLQDAKE